MFPFFGILKKAANTSLILPASTTVEDFVIATATATSQFRLNPDGNFETRTGGVGGWTNETGWVSFIGSPPFDPADYEGGWFSLTDFSSGLSYLSGPAADTYHNLASFQTWSLSKSMTSFELRWVEGTLKVREVANPANEATGTVRLQISSEV